MITSPFVAHAGQPVAPHDVASAWSFEPALTAVVVVAAVVYGRGVRRAWRGEAGRRVLPAWRVWCFAGALLTTAFAVLSPLDALGETLFGAHMFQHLLLTYLVPPLLVLGRPLLAGTLALSASGRRRVAPLRHRIAPGRRAAVGWAASAAALHAGTLWLWHLPGLYELALRQPLVHVVEHVTLIVGGLAIAWLVLDARGRHANAAGVLAIFAGVLQSGALAGLLSFGSHAWYPVHAPGAALWGLTAMEDQHIAGGLMWFPGGLPYVLAGVALFARWWRADERSAEFAASRSGSTPAT